MLKKKMVHPWQGTREKIATPVFSLICLTPTTTTTTHSQASKQRHRADLN